MSCCVSRRKHKGSFASTITLQTKQSSEYLKQLSRFIMVNAKTLTSPKVMTQLYWHRLRFDAERIAK